MPWPIRFGLVAFGLALMGLMAWMPPTPRAVVQFDRNATAVAFTSDGLLVIDRDPVDPTRSEPLVFWDLSDQKEVVMKDDYGRTLRRVDWFMKDGAFLRDPNGWFVRTDHCTYRRVPIAGYHLGLYWFEDAAPASGRMALGDPHGVVLRDAWDDGNQLLIETPCDRLALSPSGDRLVTAWRRGEDAITSPSVIKVWDCKTGREVFAFDSPGFVREFAFAAGERLLAADVEINFPTSTPGAWGVLHNLRLWDLSDGRVALDLPNAHFAAFFDNDHAILYKHHDPIGDPMRHVVTAVDLGTGVPRYEVSLKNCREGYCKDPVAPAGQPYFLVTEVKTPSPAHAITWLDQYVNLGGLAHPSFAFATHLHDLETGSHLWTFPHGCMDAPQVALDGATLAISENDGERHAIYLYDLPARRSWPRMLSAALLVGMAMACVQMLVAGFWRRVRRPMNGRGQDSL